MGTSNFARGNTSRVFAVLMDEELKCAVCSECGFQHTERDFNLNTIDECCFGCDGATFELNTVIFNPDVEDFVDFVREVAKESAPKDIQYNKENGSDRDRNYCASNLFSYRASKWFGDLEVEVQIVAQMVSGYYEGASLDYEFTIFDGNSFSDSDDAVLYAFDQSDMNNGMKVIQQRNAEQWVDIAKAQLIALTEQVFEEVSMPLRVVATFSNGETIYEKL
jgi:hypothetical protein